MNWQPIETAPKDGQEIIVRYAQQGNVKQLISWNTIHGFWQSKGEAQLHMQATHWLPILGDEDDCGMYAVYDPAYHKVKIGEFTICRMDDESVWIKRDSEEGGQFKDSLLEPVIAAFWRENF